jgi:TonB family protein
MPTYPDLARSLGIEGRVHVRISIDDGGVADARVTAGHAALRQEALRAVRSWKFAEYVRGEVDTVFYFHLEFRPLAENQNPRVEMQLPSWVRVAAVVPTW